ncbi:MAG: fibro-slime domain-containing protein, partial [Fibrobacteria bacterium]
MPSPLIGKTVRVYNPNPGEPLFIDTDGTERATTAGADNWMIFTFPANVQPQQVTFRVRSAYTGSTWWMMRTGIVAQGGGAAASFNVPDFGGGDSLWIIVDPAGPRTAPPNILTQAPKIINVLNPWQTTAPVIMVPGKRGMRAMADHCGWFTSFLLKPTDLNVYLQEINGTDSYGKGGLGSTTPYDMAAEFTAKGASTLWLDTDLNSWSTAFPNKDGSCQYMMAATVRDFNMDHPDFDFGGITGDYSVQGIVESAINPTTRLPVRSAVSGTVKGLNLFNNFDSWWKTDNTNASPALRSFETCVDIPMSKSDDGLWEYDSYKTAAHGFWPIENFTNANNTKTKASCYNNPALPDQWTTNAQPSTNMNYCMESHATFVYQRGQKFVFRGDDDVWVYINDQRVIDLGGVHIPKSDSIDLDKLRLTAGKSYNWDLFYCERQPCGSSLRIKTSIFFKQQRALDTVLTRDAATGVTMVKVIKRTGGTGSCASLGGQVTVTDATNLIYELWSATGTKLETLTSPSKTHGDGIIISIPTPQITVDTSKIVDLPPGNYRIVAYEPASQSIRIEVPFNIRNRSWVQFEPKVATVVAGTLVPVVAANRLGEAAPTGEMAYTFTVVPPTGLKIFGNSDGTSPVANSGSTGVNGLDTLWVSVDSELPAPLTFTLATTGSTRQVVITFNPLPLDLPVVKSATIHDEDADGIADRIVAVYDRDISALLPKHVAYRWPSSEAPVMTPGSALAGMVVGTTLTLSGKPLGTEVRTEGEGYFHSAYQARGRDSTQIVRLEDRIAPVLLKAEMLSGKAGDTLRLVFSEPVNTAGLALPADLFVYRINQTGADLRYTPIELRWNAGKNGADLIFTAGSLEAPRSGNLVRIMDGTGRIADAFGNGVGPNSRFRLITGTKRAEIATVTYIKVDPVLAFSNPLPLVASRVASNSKVEDVVAATGRLGHLIKVDLGDYAQADDFTKVDPDKVVLEYQVGYFTNHGLPVASEKRTISCLDKEIFAGDCRTNRGFIFVGWNFNTLTAQRVATGAYVTRIHYQVKAGGKTS